MSPSKIQAHETPTPGPRSEITVTLGDASLPQLLEGVNVERMWLTEEEPGVYGLHATRTVGESRKDDVAAKPAIDVLVALLNEFVAVLDKHEDEVPKPIAEAFDHLVDRWNEYPRTGA